MKLEGVPDEDMREIEANTRTIMFILSALEELQGRTRIGAIALYNACFAYIANHAIHCADKDPKRLETITDNICIDMRSVIESLRQRGNK